MLSANHRLDGEANEDGASADRRDVGQYSRLTLQHDAPADLWHVAFSPVLKTHTKFQLPIRAELNQPGIQEIWTRILT
jgi:hypothetical protein